MNPDYNRIIASELSSFTLGMRYDSSLNVDLNEYYTNMIPYPVIKTLSCNSFPYIFDVN